MLSEPAKSSSAKTESAAERELREKLVAAQAREAQLSAQIQRLNKRARAYAFCKSIVHNFY